MSTTVSGKANTSQLSSYLPLTGGRVGELYVGANSKLHLWEDVEGGNIRFLSPNGTIWEMDSFNNSVFRIYTGNGYPSYSFGVDGRLTAPIFSGSLEGNASSANILSTPRYIFGNAFNGSADVYGSGIFWGHATDRPSMPFNAALQIRERDQVGNTQNDLLYAPAIGFHWANVGATTLCMGADGRLYYVTQDGYGIGTIVANIAGTATYADGANYATSAGTATYADGAGYATSAGAVAWTGVSGRPTIPTSLKCPNSLTIQGNSTTIKTYDGSAAVTCNITPGNIGAAASSHTHAYSTITGRPTFSYSNGTLTISA